LAPGFETVVKGEFAMKFMVGIRFRVFVDNPMVRSLIPAQQARESELREQGIVESLHISFDGSTGWIVMQGASEAEVRQALASLPLFPYMDTDMTLLR